MFDYKEETHFIFLVVRPLGKGGGVKPSEPLSTLLDLTLLREDTQKIPLIKHLFFCVSSLKYKYGNLKNISNLSVLTVRFYIHIFL